MATPGTVAAPPNPDYPVQLEVDYAPELSRLSTVTDRFPPFTLGDVADYPVRVEVVPPIGRWPI